ncbi:hypothetical protein [Mucilaginibacter sp. SG564]|uniref:hypothetical protein n=1 Tax=Mucilaginibacter sp. SG564 TaxID=2587022 RepID=UPI001552BBC8|nr:hypothetical protein [Mucilaginibacter sp. SG564]NOW99150.1 hypothetical protein [Mucilaginibacter sp. SG564]
MKHLKEKLPELGISKVLTREHMRDMKGGILAQLVCSCLSGGGFSPKPGLSEAQIDQLTAHYCPGQSTSYCATIDV